MEEKKEKERMTNQENEKRSNGRGKHFLNPLELEKIKENVETALERGELPCSKEEAELTTQILEEMNPLSVLSRFPGITKSKLDYTTDHDHVHFPTELQEDSNSCKFIFECFEIWASEREELEEFRVVVEEGMNGWEQVEGAVRGVLSAQRQVDDSEMALMNAVERRNEIVRRFVEWGEGASLSKFFICLFFIKKYC